MRGRRPVTITPTFIEGIAGWSRPSRVRTVTGEAVQRTASPDRTFWQWWKTYRAQLSALGVSVERDEEDDWLLVWEVDEATLQTFQEPEIRGAEPMPHVHSVRPGTWHLAHCSEILREYQVAAAGTLMAALTESGFALDASDTGLGKTYSALAAVKNLGVNFGVVCPANVVSKWINTAIDVFGIEPEFVTSYDKLRAGKTDFATRGSIVRNGKTFPKFRWNTCDRVVLIFDEVHVCAGVGSLNSALLRAAIDNPDVWVLGISASATNSPLNMQVLGYGLGLHGFWDWWDWCETVGCIPGFYGGLTFDARPESAAERALVQLHAHIFPMRGVRLRKSELKGQLPNDVIIPELVDLAEVEITKSMHVALDALEDKVAADEAKAELEEREVSGFTVSMRDRQESEIRKTPVILERALELVEGGRSVAIFVHFKETISLLTEMIGKKVTLAHLVGGMGKRREEAIERFQRGKARIIICQMQAGAASIDLHNVHGNYPRASIISPGYDARQLLQALGRISRDGSHDEDCLQYLLFAAEGVELRAASIVQSKLNNLALLNDGDLAGVIQVLK